MAKNRNDYFSLAETQVSYCVRAAVLLECIFRDYSAAESSLHRENIHAIEHEADGVHHDILTRLSTEFITPIDQEDILRLVQIIDDVTDSLDEVVLESYMFHVDVLPEGADRLAGTVLRCVKALADAVHELRNFKKPAKLRSLLVEVNSIEGEADALYTEAIHTLFGSDADTKRLIGGKTILDCLEDCCDFCEHAADVIDQIIIKNT